MSKEQFIQVNDGRLFCSVSGKGEPLIFLHGNFNTHDIWSGQAEFFSAKNRVIRYDLRGYGRSSTPASRFSNVDDLNMVMNSMNVPRAVLIGSSSGGGIALDFALKHPERVKALVLYSTLYQRSTNASRDDVAWTEKLLCRSFKREACSH